MAALQSVTATDRATPTPIVHTFTPRDVKDGVGLVVRTAGVPVGEEKLTVSMRKSASKYRGKLTMALPVVVDETVNGVVTPKVVRTAYATLEVTFDETSSTQERTNLIGMLADLLGTGKVLVHSSLVNLEGVYGS
ncbi:coat protein [ssRNA phage SRR5466725_9]|uniref:Coat protein n=1 Tax=ssRNA phage SRR5466725_9 TaxID=2786428 RepID=A0A8S5L406_9VIRU|nr:coat protein [ssRNA phage SRR5466725_9]DAD52424.1 TPA_asm: coat protein [ssRNA phage SRR5466725_9]